MTKQTWPTTEVIKQAVTFPRERLGEPIPIKPEAFDRWLEQVKAEAWDEGFTAGVNHDLGDWENAPAIINNPYRSQSRRRRLICDWLRANGLDPNRVPETASIEITNKKIHTEYFVDGGNGNRARYPVTVDLVVEPREAW